jgi:hypothetical protein
MKTFSLVTTLLTLGLIAPAHAAYALDMDALIEAAKNGDGTYVETHSSVSTGGQTARGGENVQTGDASASSYTEINAGNDGGTVKVKVETSENGKTQTKEYSQDIGAGDSANVQVNAESKDGESNVEVNVDGEVVESDSQTASVAASVGAKVSLLFTEKIPSFFKKLFGFFS